MINYPRSMACGDSGVSIEFGDQINEHINAQVLALDAALMTLNPVGVIETVPTYRALLIHYDPVATTYDTVADQALALARYAVNVQPRSRLLKIPVCYEEEYGFDLPAVSQSLGLTSEQVIARHCALEYRVYMLGFQPGFAYLGGLDPNLSLPRRPRPRLGALAGTVSIAAGQCAIHASEGPSGWHWIGRTPARTFIDGATPIFAIEPGDRIRFFSITANEWHELSEAACKGGSVMEVVE